MSLFHENKKRIEKENYNPPTKKSGASSEVIKSSDLMIQDQLYNKRLVHDLNMLKNLNYAESVEYKTSCIERYKYHVENYLAAEVNSKSEVVSWYCAFLADTGQIEMFCKIMELAIKNKQQTPKNFRRSLKEFYFDEVLAFVKHEFEKAVPENAKRPYLDQLLMKLTAEKWRVNPAVEYKCWILNAKLLLHFESEKKESLKEAAASCEKAKSSYHNPKCKTLERDIARASVKLL